MNYLLRVFGIIVTAFILSGALPTPGYAGGLSTCHE
jgi:hypothetical protein